MESAPAYQPKRLLPLDALRGPNMILMAIDHANYFVVRIHPTGEFWGIAIPQYNNIAEFLTRFVTHICAPGFFFLMGAGAAFFILRILGSFGNIHPPEGTDFISFFNVTKYPPSLTFALLTLGLCLIIIGIFSRSQACLERSGNPLLVFGRSTLIFYILHLYLFALIGLFFASRGGTGLTAMYPIWVGVLIILYFLCRQYGDFKNKKPVDSIWRFF